MTNERVPRPGSLVRRVLSIGGGSALLALFAAAIAFGAPFCPSAGFLGIPCPGCGLTRATLALLSGDPERAFELHPLVFVATPAFAMLFAQGAYVAAGGAPPRMSARTTRVLTTGAALLCVALIALWLARFAGWFGGPVHVTTYAEWIRSLRH